MGINAKIFKEVERSAWVYGFEPDDVNAFLTGSQTFQERQENALEIIEKVITVHKKQELLKYVARLANVENSARTLIPSLRDHVVHALLSFLLGLYLNERFMKKRGNKVDPFQWKLAGLFHDVGYSAKVAQDILKSFAAELMNIGKELSSSRAPVGFGVDLFGFDELENGVDPFRLIQKCLNGWGLEIDARVQYDSMQHGGKLRHGIISSLSILCVIDMLYNKYNPKREYSQSDGPPDLDWSQSYFENDVVAACAAMFIHDLPDDCFTSAKIDPVRAPLPFLLRLSDCLQEWERPSGLGTQEFPEGLFDIDVISGDLVFFVADKGLKAKIEQEVATALVVDGIEFRER